MRAFTEERVLSVRHWTDRLFSFVTTRDRALRFRNGHFTMIGIKVDWAELSDFLPSDYQGPLRRSAIASSFVAALELARQGRVDLRQDGAFEPLYLKAAPMGQPA